MPSTPYKTQLCLWNDDAEMRSAHGHTSSDKTLLFLGLLLLRYLDDRISEIEVNTRHGSNYSRVPNKEIFTFQGVVYLPSEARFSNLVSLIDRLHVGQILNEAIRMVEFESISLRGSIPKTYHRLDHPTLITWIKTIAAVPSVNNTSFVEIYLQLMNKCDVGEHKETNEWFTPKSVIEMIRRMFEPYREGVIDPQCGLGGFLHECEPLGAGTLLREVTLANNLIMKGLGGVLQDIGPPLPFGKLFNAIKQGDSIYEPIQQHFSKVDTVVCNPPFNMRNIDKRRLKDDPRFPFGLPKANNSNYIFIQIIYSAIAPGHRACFLMADAASDAGGSEREVRRQLIESDAVDVMISLGMDVFGKARVPCTLWIFDKGKAKSPRHGKVMFIDAQCLNRKAGERDRPLTEAQLKFLNQIVQLYRDEFSALADGDTMLKEYFPDGRYRDVNSLCRSITTTEISKNGWSLNPRLYLRGKVDWASRISLGTRGLDDMQAMEAELKKLGERAQELEKILQEHTGELGGGVNGEVGRGVATKSVAAIPHICWELIELNIGRCAIFESQALKLYRDWFIDFKFPGHDTCEMVTSAYGDVPAGWHPASIDSLAVLFVGNKAEEDESYNRIIVIKQRCIRDTVVNLSFAKMYRARIKPDRHLQVSDILVNAVGIGTLGRVAQVNEALRGNTVDSHICIVRPREAVMANYLGLALISLQNHFAALGTGSTGNQRLRKNTIANTEILQPPQKILCEFNQEVSPIRERAIPLLMQNAFLLRNHDLPCHALLKRG
jgi:type I restriction enzyme M protein